MRGGIEAQINDLFFLSWRLATLALRLPSPQEGLTSVFGKRTGVTPPTNHQDRKNKSYARRKRVCHRFLPAGKTRDPASHRRAPALRRCAHSRLTPPTKHQRAALNPPTDGCCIRNEKT